CKKRISGMSFALRRRFVDVASSIGTAVVHAALGLAAFWLLKNDLLELALSGPVERMLNRHRISVRWEKPRWNDWCKISCETAHVRYRYGEITATLRNFGFAFTTNGIDSVGWTSGHIAIHENKRKSAVRKVQGKAPVRLRLVGAYASHRSAQLRRLWTTLQQLPVAGKLADTRIVFDTPWLEGEFWIPSATWSRVRDGVRFHANVKNECTRMPAAHVRDFVIPHLELSLTTRNGTKGFEIVEGSRVSIATFEIFPRLRYFGDSVGFDLEIPEQPVSHWFAALPEGAFDKLRKIRLAGEIGYRLVGAMNVNRPDKMTVNAKLSTEKLRLDTGSVWWITEVNGEFSWRPFGARSFRRIDPDDPRYVRLDQTPPFLRQCLLLAEDPEFYRHEGFEPTMIRDAVADNLATGRFRRGGSTLTMQLVKNLFLTPQKTLFRKIEEAGIVWCIENHDLISKDKILELYLNCAQWGPSSYGIREAAEYWFGKKPLDLTPEECVFLSTILPAPSRAINLFDENGVLNREAEAVFETMQQLLERHGTALEQPLDPQKVCLEGRALADLSPPEICP
ncbi:MAG: biosynthetic peptidoglycan transglycosylase, partial [Bacteroidia bacterium]|nr:transglycosylase domain-containing protein [Bacteroidia bacterium]MDW8333004.1 biosynthetic peptidoglycan transglycosylase [Bacteroidia bacterium]